MNVPNENIEKIKKLQISISLLSVSKEILTDGFTDEYITLQISDNIKFGIVNKEDYENKFGSLATPTLYFFNGKGILTSKIKGETKFERIIEELKKSDSPEYRQ